MHLIRIKTNEKVDAIIEEVTPSELINIKKSNRFNFEWSKEIKYSIYKIRLRNLNEILGLISLIDWPNELRIEIHLLESSKVNVGGTKTYANIPGCLIAYACGISFEKGYYGFISLVPKTSLIKHYMNEYGMENGGKSLFSDTNNSSELMKKYL